MSLGFLIMSVLFGAIAAVLYAVFSDHPAPSTTGLLPAFMFFLVAAPLMLLTAGITWFIGV